MEMSSGYRSIQIIDLAYRTRYNRASPFPLCGAREREPVGVGTMLEEVLTAEQVAEELKVNIRRVYKWIQSRELIATDVGTPARHNYRIQRSDLEDFRRRRRTDQR